MTLEFLVDPEDGPDIVELCMGKNPNSLPSASLEAKEMGDAIEGSLQRLTPMGREVIERRFGVGGREPESTKEIAGYFGVSTSRILQVEAKALRRLRNPASSKNLKEHWGDGESWVDRQVGNFR